MFLLWVKNYARLCECSPEQDKDLTLNFKEGDIKKKEKEKIISTSDNCLGVNFSRQRDRDSEEESTSSHLWAIFE